MADAEQLSELIEEIYDAALDASLWRDVVGKAARFVGGRVGTLFWKGPPVGNNGGVYYESGIDPYYRDLYFEKYIKLDPTTTGQYFADVGQPITVADLMPYGEFEETQFYKEWVQPQGLVDFVSAALDKSATSAAFFGVFRYETDGLADDETRRRMRLIAPHVRRAVLTGRAIDLKSAESQSFVDVLEKLNTGICLVGSAGRIIHANGLCREILEAGDPLSGAGGRIAARDGRANDSLHTCIANAGAGDAALGTQGIALPLCGQDGAHYLLHVLPLTSGSRRLTGRAFSATAALFVRRARLEAFPPSEVMARTFKLTPSELRVLLAIVDVGGVPEVAVSLGIGETTVKTHLRRLFHKIGAERQADLVKVVAAFASPLVG